jgi:hypothetical protein
MITQRPQSVNKEVLSQVECLCVLQVNGRHEREAIQKWVEEHGADRALVGELPSLQQGEGYVWSPSWLRIYQKMRFAQKTTFDASATPKVGAKAKTATLSKIDVDALKADMQEVIARAEKDDPKALHKRIVELEKQLKKQPAAAAPAPPAIVEKIDVEVVTRELRKQIERFLSDKFIPEVNAVFKATENLRRAMLEPSSWTFEIPIKAIRTPKSPPVQQFADAKMQTPLQRPRTASANGTELNGPEQRILDAIAWFEGIGVADPEQSAVAFLAGYSIKSSSYSVPRSTLLKKQTVEYLGSGRIRLTDEGRALAHDPGIPATNEGLHQMVLSKLAGPERRLLGVLLQSFPGHLSNEDLAAAAGYSVGSSSYSVPRSRLKSFGLIEYPKSGRVRARSVLFPMT